MPWYYNVSSSHLKEREKGFLKNNIKEGDGEEQCSCQGHSDISRFCIFCHVALLCTVRMPIRSQSSPCDSFPFVCIVAVSCHTFSAACPCAECKLQTHPTLSAAILRNSSVLLFTANTVALQKEWNPTCIFYGLMLLWFCFLKKLCFCSFIIRWNIKNLTLVS